MLGTHLLQERPTQPSIPDAVPYSAQSIVRCLDPNADPVSENGVPFYQLVAEEVVATC
jgi:hypothetical protein